MSKLEEKNKEYSDICHKDNEYCCRIGGPFTSKKEVDEIIEAGYENRFQKRGDFFIVKTRKDGSCLYLENHRCSIYDKRPIVCRSWPVIVVMKNGKREYRMGEDCPLAEHLTEEDIEIAKRELEKLSDKHIIDMVEFADECGYKAKKEI